ncbi:radical SAM protein [bacterium]|nr:radical SAM protein [bacterium]
MGNTSLKPSVILVADRTLCSNYRILFEGIFATMQTTKVPELAMKRLVSPPMPIDSHGRAKAAPLGLRRMESALIKQGIVKENEVVCTTPEGLPKLLGPWVKVLGVSSSDPLGQGMSNTTTDKFWSGELYTRYWTAKMMADMKKAKQQYGFQVVGGGAGAWQWMNNPQEAENQGIDTLFVGYGEAKGADLIRRLLKKEDFSPVMEEEGTAGEHIPPIHHPSLLGIVELSRGCGKGCRFCTLSKKSMYHLPADTILSDMETNVANGITSVVSGSEDFFRYGASGSEINFETLRNLLVDMKQIKGLSFMQIDHANISSVLQMTDEQLKEIRALLQWQQKTDYLWINMGVESANGRLVAANSPGKIHPFDPENWESMVKEAVDRLSRTGFFPVLSLILGLPGETEEDINRTIKLVDDISRQPAVVFPVFYEPVLPGEPKFSLEHMTQKHLALYTQCYEINFKYVPLMYWDNQRAGGVPWHQRALIRLLGKTEMQAWRKRFRQLESTLSSK